MASVRFTQLGLSPNCDKILSPQKPGPQSFGDWSPVLMTMRFIYCCMSIMSAEPDPFSRQTYSVAVMTTQLSPLVPLPIRNAPELAGRSDPTPEFRSSRIDRK